MMFGFALHDELPLLVKAGLSPAQALRAATLNPAEFVGKSRDFGTVAAGKFADILVLDANPLEDVRNTKRIHAVVYDGKLFDRAALHQLLEQQAAAVRKLDSAQRPPR